MRRKEAVAAARVAEAAEPTRAAQATQAAQAEATQAAAHWLALSQKKGMEGTTRWPRTDGSDPGMIFFSQLRGPASCEESDNVLSWSLDAPAK